MSTIFSGDEIKGVMLGDWTAYERVTRIAGATRYDVRCALDEAKEQRALIDADASDALADIDARIAQLRSVLAGGES